MFLEQGISNKFEYVKSPNGMGMWMIVDSISHLSPEDQVLYEMCKNIDLKVLFKSREIKDKLDERLKNEVYKYRETIP